jgi:hypothetical protein
MKECKSCWKAETDGVVDRHRRGHGTGVGFARVGAEAGQAAAAAFGKTRKPRPRGPRAMNQLDSFVEIVGRDGSGWAHYWMVDSTGALVDSFGLATLPGATDLWVMDINNQGQIVGFQRGSDSSYAPLVWASPQSLPIELPLAGYAEGTATSLNDEGVVVGHAWNEVAPGEFDRALIAWKIAVSGSDIIVLDTQPIVTGLEYIEGVHLANNGYVTYYDQNSHAFRLVLAWDGLQLSEVVGSRTQLFACPAQTSGVNDHGTVCGRYHNGRHYVPFAMTVAGDLLDLPTLPGGKERGKTYEMRNEVTTAINHNNQLVGMGNSTSRRGTSWVTGTT